MLERRITERLPVSGRSPRPPYDVTGYTLAYQMGVKVDRILDAFDGPLEKLPLTPIPLGGGKVAAPAKGKAAGYLLSHRLTDAFTATTRLLAAKEDVYWLKAPFASGGKTYETGTIYVPRNQRRRRSWRNWQRNSASGSMQPPPSPPAKR